MSRPGVGTGDAVAVDPAISSGLPLPTVNRQPPPGSRPEKYSTPATKGISHHLPSYFPLMTTHVHCPASDPAQNPYWKRDVRRAYPQLSVVTQSELSTLLIQHSGAAESVKPLAHIPPHPHPHPIPLLTHCVYLSTGLQRHWAQTPHQ